MADEQRAAPVVRQKPSAQKQQVEINIVRIAGKDINGNLKVSRAIAQVKGVGYNLANAIEDVAAKKFSIGKDETIGSLSEEKMTALESIIKEPSKFGIPTYILNRRKDPETGLSAQLTGTDLLVMTRQDIDRDIKVQTWRGFRHQTGQKVNGQKSSSTGRTGETVGVTKKRIQAELKKAAGGEAPKGAAGAGNAEAASKEAKK